jgi:hypothetical protein
LKKRDNFFSWSPPYFVKWREVYVDPGKSVPLKWITLSRVEISRFFTRCFSPKNLLDQGPIYGFLKYFRKKMAKKFAFLTQNKAKLCINLIITLVFEKNAISFAENCQKSPKIVIITSTPVQTYLFYLVLRFLCDRQWKRSADFFQSVFIGQSSVGGHSFLLKLSPFILARFDLTIQALQRRRYH